jgi:formate/nitrite transporter FocA (FNT family)
VRSRAEQQQDAVPDPTNSPEESFSAAAKLDELSDQQKHEIEHQSRPNAALIHETIRTSELERDSLPLALSALAAGLSMGFSLIVEGKLRALLPEGYLRELISPLGYTVGFLIVVLGRQQLFTENTLTPMLPLMHNRDMKTLLQVMRLWSIVLAANVAGAILAATAIAHAGAFDKELLSAFDEISRAAPRAPFQGTFVHAVYAGWMIALMVWLLPGAETARTLIIIIITYIVAVMGFSHIIAGTVDCAFAVERGIATWQDFTWRFFLPTVLGNIVGGVALVAALNYGQVAPEIGSKDKDKGSRHPVSVVARRVPRGM